MENRFVKFRWVYAVVLSFLGLAVVLTNGAPPGDLKTGTSLIGDIRFRSFRSNEDFDGYLLQMLENRSDGTFILIATDGSIEGTHTVTFNETITAFRDILVINNRIFVLFDIGIVMINNDFLGYQFIYVDANFDFDDAAVYNNAVYISNKTNIISVSENGDIEVVFENSISANEILFSGVSYNNQRLLGYITDTSRKDHPIVIDNQGSVQVLDRFVTNDCEFFKYEYIAHSGDIVVISCLSNNVQPVFTSGRLDINSIATFNTSITKFLYPFVEIGGSIFLYDREGSGALASNNFWIKSSYDGTIAPIGSETFDFDSFIGVTSNRYLCFYSNHNSSVGAEPYAFDTETGELGFLGDLNEGPASSLTFGRRMLQNSEQTRLHNLRSYGFSNGDYLFFETNSPENRLYLTNSLPGDDGIITQIDDDIVNNFGVISDTLVYFKESVEDVIEIKYFNSSATIQEDISNDNEPESSAATRLSMVPRNLLLDHAFLLAIYIALHLGYSY